MGQNHVRVLYQRSNLIGGCDSNPEAGEKIAAKFKTKYYKKVDDLLGSGVEAVSIVTPTFAHYDVSKKVIDAGVIDGMVNGAGASVRGSAALLRLIQTGSVRAYAGAIFVGVLLVVGYFLVR